MKIIVNGTEKHLKIIGNNGIEWTEDFIENHDQKHDEDGNTVMTEEDFLYWEGEIELQERIDELIDTLRPEHEAEVDEACRMHANDRDGLYAELQQIVENI